MQYLIQRRLKNPNIDNIEKEKLENRLTQINQIDVEKDIALEQACANAPLSANCQTLMKEVKNYEFGYFGTSSQSGNYYGMPVYTRNNLLYGEDANKVAAYSKQYDLLTHLKEKNIQDIAKSYNIDSRYLNYIDSGSQIVGNVLSSVAAVKIGKNQTEYPSSGVSTYHREKVGDVDYPLLTLGEVKKIDGVDYIRVGRWMSKDELSLMKGNNKIVSGAGGQTFISINGANDYKGAAGKGSVYVEFNVPKNSLIQGGKEGWFKMIGENAQKSQKMLLQKQGGELSPKVQDIKILDGK